MKHQAILQFCLRAAFAAVGLWLASGILDGLHFDNAQTLVMAALLLGVINAVVRPLVLILTLPITVVTLGFFLLVVNAGMLGLVAWMLEGFTIASFWTAVGASLIVSFCSGIAAALAGGVKIHFDIKRH
ncbi:MAG: phage holin family protein [Steroidobacteraceae bacterium]